MKNLFTALIAGLCAALRVRPSGRSAINEVYSQDATTRELLTATLTETCDRYVGITAGGAVAAVGETIWGISQDSGVSGDIIQVKPLHNSGTHLVKATVTITSGSELFMDANGQAVLINPTGAVAFGYAVEAGVAGQAVEFIPSGVIGIPS